VPQLIETGTVVYPWLGVSSSPDVRLGELSAVLDLPVQAGVLIERVSPDSPAERAGLRGATDEIVLRGITVQVGGDIIVAVNGIFVRDLDELLAYLVENTKPGDRITLTVVRGNQTLEIEAVVGARPED
jgi:S1-C subfamily serine protease